MVIQAKAKSLFDDLKKQQYLTIMLVAVNPRMKHLKLVTAGLKESKLEQIYTASLLKAKQLALILLMQLATRQS